MFVAITTLLGLSVYQLIVNNSLPTTSDAIPLLGNYYYYYTTTTTNSNNNKVVCVLREFCQDVTKTGVIITMTGKIFMRNS